MQFKEVPSVLELKEELNSDHLEFNKIVQHETLQEDLEQNLQQYINVITMESPGESTVENVKDVRERKDEWKGLPKAGIPVQKTNWVTEEPFDQEFVLGYCFIKFS